MPQQKDLKRIVRARMEKTGESYTTARLHTVKKKEAPAPPPPDYAALSGVSESALQKATGRPWSEWVQILDAADAASKPHGEIAKLVFAQGAVSGWWSQSVSVGYERIKGLREIGQRRTGSWEGSKSRTFNLAADALFEYFANARKRAKWLPDVKPTVKTSTKGRSMRLAWEDGTAVTFWFTPKGDAKTSVAVQHTKLPDKAAVEKVKQFWGERLDALGAML